MGFGALDELETLELLLFNVGESFEIERKTSLDRCFSLYTIDGNDVGGKKIFMEPSAVRIAFIWLGGIMGVDFSSVFLKLNAGG